MSLLDSLNPIKGIVDTVAGVIDQFVTSDGEKLEAQKALAEAEREATAQLLDYEESRLRERAKTVRQEVASSHWLAANWRPILMLTFTYIILHNYVIVPIFNVPAASIPADMWELLKIGVGGYVIGRSAEKIAPTIGGRRSEGETERIAREVMRHMGDASS